MFQCFEWVFGPFGALHRVDNLRTLGCSRGLFLKDSREDPSKGPSRTQIRPGANIQIAGGLRTQIAGGSVKGNAIGDGEAAANRIAVHTSSSDLHTEAPGKVCVHTFAQNV